MANQSILWLPRESTVRDTISKITNLYLSKRTLISRALVFAFVAGLANRTRHAIADQKAASAREAEQRSARKGTTSTSDEQDVNEASGKKKKKVALNREFFRALLRLLKIVVPGWWSKESKLIMTHSLFLFIRSLLSVHVASLDGQIVSSLIRGRGKEFMMRIMWWMVVAVPATFTNSMVLDSCQPTGHEESGR